MLVITADVDEEASGVPFLLEQLGAHVERRRLRFGDYVVGPETVVERKSALDLHKTIAAGRLWPQMGRLRRAGRWPYLIIEGGRLWQGPVGADAVRGLCLAVSDLGIAVLRTDDADDTARWLYRLAVRRGEGAIRDRPAYAQRPQRPARITPAEQALAAAPGVSVTTARAILRHFGSLEDVVLANPDQWKAVPGVGPRRATALAAMIRDRWPTDEAS
jgi:DNA excision repair protein ERCC-4